MGFCLYDVSNCLSVENPAIAAGFHIGFADKPKINKKSAQNVFVPKAPAAGRLLENPFTGSKKSLHGR